MPSSQRQRHYHRDDDLTRPYPRRRYSSEAHHSRDYDRRRRRSHEDYGDRYETRRSRDDASRPRHSRSRSYRDDGDISNVINPKSKTSQALAAAVTAGAVEALKVRKDPGPWAGKKGVRVVSAAIGAAALDAAVDKNPKDKPKRHVAEATAASLVVNHLLNRGK